MRKLKMDQKPKAPWAALAFCLVLGLLLLIPRPAPAETAPTATEPTARTETAPEAREEERLRILLEKQEKLREFTDENLRKAKAKFASKLSYQEGNIHYHILQGGEHVQVDYDVELHTPFTEYTDGAVYFIANGEHLDITKEFSEEEPFTYIFTDRYFLEHYIAIGGTADNPGWVEMLYTAWEEKPYSFVCGSGVNTWNVDADARYLWHTRAQEIFGEDDVHWPD